MGLDMYAMTTKRRLKREIDFKTAEADVQIHCWRKHPNLHGWMEQLYEGKGGTEIFNCTTVALTSDDLDELEAAIRNGKLPVTTGFFFGATDGSEVEDDLSFVATARQALGNRLTVYYRAWW
jgi:hypothetical protein